MAVYGTGLAWATMKRTALAIHYKPVTRRMLEMRGGGAQSPQMIERRPFDIDMRPDGTFVDAARQTRPPGWSPRPVGGLSKTFAIGAVIFGSVIVAGLALSLALVLVPVAIGAALLGYAALRVQMWRMRRSGMTPASWRGNFGPVMAQFEAMLKARRPPPRR